MIDALDHLSIAVSAAHLAEAARDYEIAVDPHNRLRRVLHFSSRTCASRLLQMPPRRPG
jgi:hypothetical protein